jgi:xanthine dehydrogenase YagT iron-sulfur-binding subunit
VALRVNGQRYEQEVDTRTTLLDLLREHLHLTGTKKGCDQGQCGACTVIADGRRINSCLSLAVMHEGARSRPSRAWAARQAASDAGGLREARRLPVRLLHAGPDLLRGGDAGRGPARHPEPCHGRPERAPLLSPMEMRERMSGNICRCGAYSNIMDAITKSPAVSAAGGKA